MKIWEVSVDVKKFASAYLTDNEGNILSFYTDWPDFRGQLFGANWLRPTGKLQEGKIVGNFVDIDPGILVCDSYTWICLENYIQNEIEVLGIDVEGIDLKILNITNIVDCLDEEKSEALYLRDNQRIMHIKKFSFNKELLNETMLFKIPQLSRSPV